MTTSNSQPYECSFLPALNPPLSPSHRAALIKPADMRSTTLLLAASTLFNSSLAFVILPNAFRSLTPDINIESDKQDIITSIDDQLQKIRHKCLETESRSPPSSLSITPQPSKPNAETLPPAVLLSNDDDDDSDQPLPVIIWHGLGDKAGSDGMKAIAEILNEVNPGTYVYEISLGGDSVGGSADQQASFFGQLPAQLSSVCDALAKDNILQTAPAVDLLGFSQGGLFLRGLVQTCGGKGGHLPRPRTLLTFGAPHNGIAKFQRCKESGDWVCRAAETLVKTGGVFTSFVQDRVIPAQYFRDPRDLDAYLEGSKWLADINNERNKKNASYAENLAELERFVMVQFDQDETVVPKQSTWFADVDLDSGVVTGLKDRAVFKEDWIGLKSLDERGALVFRNVTGGHMQMKEKELKKMFADYFGPLESRGDEWVEEVVDEIDGWLEEVQAELGWAEEL